MNLGIEMHNKNDIVKSEIHHLQIILFIKKQLHKKLSERITELMNDGYSQNLIGKMTGLDQPKISSLKKNNKIVFTDSKAMYILRLLNVYCTIDTRKDIPDIIKFDTDDDIKSKI